MLEIGAGNALPSFLCAQVGAAAVIASDGDATEVSMVRKSVANGYVVGEGCTFEPKLLWWGYPAGDKQMPEKKKKIDVVVACEVCYNPNDIHLVADTIDYFLAPDGVALVMNTCTVSTGTIKDQTIQSDLKATWEGLLTEKGMAWEDVDMLPFRTEGQEQLETDYFMRITRE